MSEIDDIKHEIIDQLDHMSTEELEELLKTYSQSSENTDMDYIFSLLEVIEKREILNQSGKYSDVDTAWVSFQKNYRPASNEAESLYDFTEAVTDSAISHSDINDPIYANRHVRRPIKHKAFLRMACVLVSLIIVLLSSTIVAKAFGFDLWGAVAKWTSETFGFTTEETTAPTQISNSSGSEYSGLNEALTYYGIDEALAPKWIPDGFTLAQINVIESPRKTSFNAVYNFSDKVITIVITKLADGTNGTYEKDDSSLTIYEKNDILHYIMANNEQEMAVWTFENFECYISGNISESQLKKMIDSIYER